MSFKTKLFHIFILIPIIISSSNNFLLPINIEKDKLFYYYVTLYFGEEKVPQTFTLDTTSSLISSPCNLCKSCGFHANEYYNITNQENQVLSCNDLNCGKLSGNCEEEKCSYQYNYYEDAYIKGVFVNNEIRFKNDSSESYKMTIGCTLNETNYIIAQESDGIMGLNNDDNSFINRLYKNKIISNNLFSLCLTHENTGYFSLGEIYDKYHLSSKIYYIPFTIDREEKYYKIGIKSFEIGEKNFDFNGEAIIDSTATLTLFPKNLYESIVNEIINKCTDSLCGKLVKNKNFGLCAVYKNETLMINSVKNWFDILINFKKLKFIWKAENYWVDISTESNYRACFGFESTDEDIITLGTTFFHGIDVIFDRDNNKIGFVESDCKADFNFSNPRRIFKATNKALNILQSSKEDIEITNKNSDYNNNTRSYIEYRGYKPRYFLYFLLFGLIFIVSIVLVLFILYKFGKKRNKYIKRLRKTKKLKSIFKDREESISLNK